MSNKSELLVSIIMPTYNTGNYIGKAIESVLAQTFTGFELVIVNDGSTDNTKEIVQSFGDDRIRYFELDKNCGRGFARNYAIGKCTGQYIAICDADDISLPDRLEMQVRFLEKNQDIDIIGTQLLHFSGKSKPSKIYHFPETPDLVKDFFKKGIMGVPHASCMLRKKCLEKIKYEDSIAYNVEDFELFIRLNKFFRMACLPQALVLYRNELSEITKERIKKHELYHHYALYSANAKLNNTACDSFEHWSRTYANTWKHKKRSALTYYKVKIKQGIRLLKAGTDT